MQKVLLAVALWFMLAPVRADDFFLSYWCGPTQDQDLDARHAEVAECGFTYAMPPCAGITPENIKKALKACQKHGLKYMVTDSRIMRFGPENPEFKTNLAAVISEYSKYPALGGYLITDEPGPELFPQLAAIHQYLVEHDPKRLSMINLYPNYAPDWALGGTYEQHIEKFLTTVKPRLLSFDHYALMKGGTERPIYFDNLEIIRRQGLKHGVPIGFIFQMISHFNYREPSEAELRWQANTGLAYGCRALLYFTYWTPTNNSDFQKTDGIIDRKGNRSPHYEMVKRINGEIRAWAPTLMQLTSTEVYHTAPLPVSTRALPTNTFVTVKTEIPLIIGTFRHEDGSEWMMVMNRDMQQAAQTTLQFEKSIKGLRELSVKNGKLTKAKLRKNELPLELTAGGAKLFKLSR